MLTFAENDAVKGDAPVKQNVKGYPLRCIFDSHSLLDT